jgi:hypothetical protein
MFLTKLTAPQLRVGTTLRVCCGRCQGVNKVVHHVARMTFYPRKSDGPWTVKRHGKQLLPQVTIRDGLAPTSSSSRAGANPRTTGRQSI